MPDLISGLRRATEQPAVGGSVVFWPTGLLTDAADEIERLRAALRLGRECVVESFEYAKTHDDTMLAEARLRDIDEALKL